MSGAYERDAKVLIGDEAWTKITNAASSGRISAQQMKDVAWALPTDRDKDKIGAEHEIRMNEKGTKPNETEMKNILKDWFYHGDMPEERGEALEVLIKAFDDNGVEVYTLIITFTELEVVLDSSKSGNFQFTTPVYLKMAPKRMLLIKQDIFFWYPKNNTDLSKRWVEFKVVGTRMNEAHVERESET